MFFKNPSLPHTPIILLGFLTSSTITSPFLPSIPFLINLNFLFFNKATFKKFSVSTLVSIKELSEFSISNLKTVIFFYLVDLNLAE